MDFIDIPGASGASYRFRLWPDGTHHAPIAGNYIVVNTRGASADVRLIGVTSDLSRVREGALAGRAGCALYTRLNVARVTRTAEHDDIAAKHPAAEVQRSDA